MEIKQTVSLDDLSHLKQQFMEQTTAPLDGMWLCGFVPEATHFSFWQGDRLIGYCCLNGEGYLLQFFLLPEFEEQAPNWFKAILEGKSPVGKVAGAFASTAEPAYFSLCLDQFSFFEVHTLMYQFEGSDANSSCSDELSLQQMGMDQWQKPTQFAAIHMGAPEDWLKNYFKRLINRGELWGLWQGERLVATGECRSDDHYQRGYADLGVIVATEERGKGLATRVLKALSRIAFSQGLQPICSTEVKNIASQKAIRRAGFVAPNRIVQFENITMSS